MTTGRLEPGPAGILAVTINPSPFWPVGIRLGAAASFAGRTRFRPSAGCIGTCAPGSGDRGTLRAAFADLTVTLPLPAVDVRLAAGPAIRQYDYPDLICACEPPRLGELFPEPFFSRSTRRYLPLPLWHRRGPAIGSARRYSRDSNSLEVRPRPRPSILLGFALCHFGT